MLRPWPYKKVGRAWGYGEVRRRFMQTLLAWDTLGEVVLRLGSERIKNRAVVTVQYARYVREKSGLAWPNRGQGNRAMRRMSALYGVECRGERRQLPSDQD